MRWRLLPPHVLTLFLSLKTHDFFKAPFFGRRAPNAVTTTCELLETICSFITEPVLSGWSVQLGQCDSFWSTDHLPTEIRLFPSTFGVQLDPSAVDTGGG